VSNFVKRSFHDVNDVSYSPTFTVRP